VVRKREEEEAMGEEGIEGEVTVEWRGGKYGWPVGVW
jgi:hypothetical protein